jgi:uncharacterized LabA/DUF88 family protein
LTSSSFGYTVNSFLPVVRLRPHWRGLSFSEPVRVAVYIDWQNVYKAARSAFGLQALPNEFGNFSPFRLARLVASANGRGPQGELVRVEVHRGLPSSSHDPEGYGANRRQAAAWMRENEEIVIPRLRPLRYPRDRAEPPVEKGIDVQLALAAVEHVFRDVCDVAVVFSHDSDLLPAIELIARLTDASHVETASWRSATFSSRLRIPGRTGIYHHYLDRALFDAVATPINYAYRGEQR